MQLSLLFELTKSCFAIEPDTANMLNTFEETTRHPSYVIFDEPIQALKVSSVKEQEWLIIWEARPTVNCSELLMDDLQNSAKPMVANLCIQPSEDEKTFELSAMVENRRSRFRWLYSAKYLGRDRNNCPYQAVNYKLEEAFSVYIARLQLKALQGIRLVSFNIEIVWWDLLWAQW